MIKKIKLILLVANLLFMKNSFACHTLEIKQLNVLLIGAKAKFGANAIQLGVLCPSQERPLIILAGKLARNNEQKVEESSIFQVGSVTKTFTASAIIDLIREQRLSLNDTVGQFLPEYPLWSKITLRQLLDHTSGVFDYSESHFWWLRLMLFTHWTPKQLLDIAYGKFYFSPGTGWHYSNTDYVILGLILESVTKQSVAQYFSAHYFTSGEIALQYTYYLPKQDSATVEAKLVHGYNQLGFDVSYIDGEWLQASGAILSNTHDLAIWYRYFISRIQEYLINYVGATVDEPFPNGFFLDESYTMGVFTTETIMGTLYYTPGLTPGYTTLVGYLPASGVTFAYIITTGYTKANIHEYLLGRLLPLLKCN